MPWGMIAAAVAPSLINDIFGSSSGNQTAAQVGGGVASVLSGQRGANAVNTAAGQQLAGINSAMNTIGTAGGAAGNNLNTGLSRQISALQSYGGAAGTSLNNGLGNIQNTQAAAMGQVAGLQNPTIAAGQNAMGALSSGLSGGVAPGSLLAGAGTQPFSMADALNSEAYKFALQQAQGASNNAAAVGGTQLSSGNLMALQQNAAGLASQTEQQAFNQWLQTQQLSNSQKAQNINALSGVAGMGQNAASLLSNAALGSANTVSNAFGNNASSMAKLNMDLGNQSASAYGANVNNLATLDMQMAEQQANLQTSYGATQAGGTIGAEKALQSGVSGGINQILGSGVMNSIGGMLGNASNQLSSLFGMGSGSAGVSAGNNLDYSGLSSGNVASYGGFIPMGGSSGFDALASFTP